MPRLVDDLASMDQPTQIWAIEGLNFIGRDAFDAVPRLIDVMMWGDKTDNQAVVLACVRAIDSIDPSLTHPTWREWQNTGNGLTRGLGLAKSSPRSPAANRPAPRQESEREFGSQEFVPGFGRSGMSQPPRRESDIEQSRHTTRDEEPLREKWDDGDIYMAGYFWITGFQKDAIDRLKSTNALRVPTTTLVSWAGSDQDYIRCGAVLALGEVATRTKPVLTALETAQKDKNPFIRRAANTALSKVKSRPVK